MATRPIDYTHDRSDRDARRRADREDPQNRGHGLRWFSLWPFLPSTDIKAHARQINRLYCRCQLSSPR